MLLVQRQALSLPVRSSRSAHLWTLIPVQAEPAQRIEDRRHRFIRRPFDIGVFYPKDEDSILMAGE
jgi:hypothetical protein